MKYLCQQFTVHNKHFHPAILNLNFLETCGPLQACNGTDLWFWQRSPKQTRCHEPAIFLNNRSSVN